MHTTDKIEVLDFHDMFFRNMQEDDDVFIKTVKDVEKIVHSSIEYRRYIQYLKQELGRTTCSALTQIDIEDAKGVSLEFHHYPFTIFDIIFVVSSRYRKDDHVDCFAVANEVMLLHYRNEVQLIPLTITAHELAHDGILEIPKDKIHGDCEPFVEKYRDYIPQEMMMKYLQYKESKITGSNERILSIDRMELEIDENEYEMLEYNNDKNQLSALLEE